MYVVYDLLEVLARDVSLRSKVLVEEDETGCHDAEEDSKSKHDEVSNGFGEWWLTSEEGILATVLLKDSRETLLIKYKAHGFVGFVSVRWSGYFSLRDARSKL